MLNAFPPHRDKIIDVITSPEEQVAIFADRNIIRVLTLRGADNTGLFADWQETIAFLVALHKEDCVLMSKAIGLMAEAEGIRPEFFESISADEMLQIVCARVMEHDISCEELISKLGECSDYLMQKYFTPEFIQATNFERSEG
jgi:hypothetical protein